MLDWSARAFVSPDRKILGSYPDVAALARSTPRDDPTAALRPLLVGPPRLTLAVAESVTCGQLQAAIGAISGASEYFLGGVTAYALEEKIRHLGVDPALAARDNGVSPAIAAAMATGACRLFGSDVGVATTGYAEPAVARGFAQPGGFWAVVRKAGDGTCHLARHGSLFGTRGENRIEMQQAIATAALTGLLDFLRVFRAAERESKFA
jgi:nicotinamide-nucleotide amidase